MSKNNVETIHVRLRSAPSERVPVQVAWFPVSLVDPVHDGLYIMENEDCGTRFPVLWENGKWYSTKPKIRLFVLSDRPKAYCKWAGMVRTGTLPVDNMGAFHKHNESLRRMHPIEYEQGFRVVRVDVTLHRSVAAIPHRDSVVVRAPDGYFLATVKKAGEKEKLCVLPVDGRED